MKHLIFLAPLLVLAGCRKHDTPPPPPATCLISQATHTGSPVNIGPTKFTYDTQGRLISTVESDTIITTFTRAGDSVVANTTVPRGPVSRVIIHNNKDGLATNIRVTFNFEDALWFNISYEYNGQQLARSVFTSSTRPDTLVTAFTWSAGNMVSSTNDSTTEKFDYYTDQPRQQGDPQFLDQFSQGFEIIRTKDLIRSRDRLTYTYEFRPDGKITAVTAKDTVGETFITHYDYDCK